MSLPRTARGLCAFAGVLGFLGIAGDVLNVELLGAFIHGRARMQIGTAVCVIVASIGLAWQHASPTRVRTACSRAAGGLVALFGALVLAEYALGVSLGLRWSVAREVTSAPYAGHVSPLAAAALVALGSSVLSFERRSAGRLRDALSVAALLTALVGVLGHAFAAAPFYALGGTTVIGISLPTSLALSALGTAACLRKPWTGLLQLATASGPGGVLLRRLGLTAFLAAPLLGASLVKLVGMAGLVELPLIVALVSVLASTCSVLLIATTAGALERTAQGAERSRLRAEELFENASEGIFVADLSGRYTEVNAAGCRLLGCTRAEIVGKTILDFIPTHDIERLALARELLLAGAVHIDAWQLRRKDGSYADVEVSAKILSDGRWQGFVRDMSERQELRRDLLESRDFLQRVLESSTEYGIVAQDLNRVVVLWNEGARRSFGHELTEIAGRSSDVLVSPDHCDVWRALHAQALRDGKAEGNVLACRKDGSTFTAKIVCTRRVGPDGVVAGVLVVCRDLTPEQRRLEEQEFLSRVGVELAACLETRETLTRVTQLATGFLGDLVVVDLLSEGHLAREHARERGPAFAVADAVTQLGAAQRPGHPLQKVLQTQEPLLLSTITAADRQQFATSPEHARVLDEVNATSAMLVPMVARGQLRAVLSICARNGSRTYGPEDLRLAMELARRAALTLDNVQLFQQSRVQGAMTMHLAEGALLVRAADSIIVYANPRFEQMFGFASQELLGAPMQVLAAKLPDDQAFDASVAAALLDESNTWHGDLQCTRKDGSTLWCSVGMSNFDHEQYGRVWIAVCADITQSRQLEQQTARALHEKEVLLREIHHRVKNNLQVICSLFSLQRSRTDNAELRGLLNECCTRVESIALVHEQLYRSTELAAIDFHEYLRHLISAVRSSFGAHGVQVEVDARGVLLDIEQAVPCALLVCELITNSFKHAFGPSGGRIWVRAARDTRGACVLDIGDDGRGIDPAIDWAQASTLGLRLVRGFARQLRATTNLDRTHGTRFTLRFALSGTGQDLSEAQAMA